MAEHPVFAVVGHPNKGKSSVVAALTQNDQVRISPVSGTTRMAQHFSLRLEREVVFELVDTPGFQRAPSCYQWLTQVEVAADRRPARVREFVDTFRGQARFVDEVELLAPIVDGAGIIYVVDGSLPYSAEYETEMKILRWTGRPRLALINPIGGDGYIDQWQLALNQYFSLVRVFDPMQAGFDQHLQLLRAFGQLEPVAEARFEQAIVELERYRDTKLRQAARVIVDGLHGLLTWQTSVPLSPQAPALAREWLRAETERFNRQLNRMEQDNRRQLEALFLYHGLDARLRELRLDQGALMDREQWSLWGLDTRQLLLASAGAGAALGLVADAGLGGASLMTGAVGGGVAGAVSAWLGTDWLKRKLPAWARAVSTTRIIGPVKEPNFAFVALGRALSHAQAMLAHSHADREALEIPVEQVNQMQSLDTASQVKLLRLCQQLRRGGLQSAAAGQLQDWVYDRLRNR